MQDQEFVQICLGMQSYKTKNFSKYLSLGTETKYFAGEILTPPQCDHYLCYIAKGGFKFTTAQLDGEVYDLAHLQQGSLIQFIAHTYENPYMYHSEVVAVENSVVVSFSGHQFYQLIQSDEALFLDLVNSMSTYNSMLRERLFLTCNVSSSQRLLNWLEKLCLSQQPNKEGHYVIKCDLTQQQIANLLFIHITTCNKVFAKLNKEQIAAHSRKKITIYDLDKLRFYRDEKLKLL